NEKKIERVLCNKGLTLLEYYPDNDAAIKAGLECFKTAIESFYLASFNQKLTLQIITVNDTALSIIKKRAKNYIQNNDMSPDAITCCCVAAALANGLFKITNVHPSKTRTE